MALDDDVDPTDINPVLWALSPRCNPGQDVEFLKNTWSSPLDPSQYPPALRPYGSKALIDACKPHRHLANFPTPTLADAGDLRARARTLGRARVRGTPAGAGGVPSGAKLAMR